MCSADFFLGFLALLFPPLPGKKLLMFYHLDSHPSMPSSHKLQAAVTLCYMSCAKRMLST